MTEATDKETAETVSETVEVEQAVSETRPVIGKLLLAVLNRETKKRVRCVRDV